MPGTGAGVKDKPRARLSFERLNRDACKPSRRAEDESWRGEAEIRLPSGPSCRWRTRLLICLSSFSYKKDRLENLGLMTIRATRAISGDDGVSLKYCIKFLYLKERPDTAPVESPVLLLKG